MILTVHDELLFEALEGGGGPAPGLARGSWGAPPPPPALPLAVGVGRGCNGTEP